MEVAQVREPSHPSSEHVFFGMNRTFKIRVNGEIRGTPRVRVVGADGEMLGVMRLAEALRLALMHGLDLVEVNPNGDPPVCKILDFDKYRFTAKRNAAAAKQEDDPDDDDEPERS